MRWFAHVNRRDEGYIERRMLKLYSWQVRGRPKRRSKDAVRDDMKVAGYRGRCRKQNQMGSWMCGPALWNVKCIYMC